MNVDDRSLRDKLASLGETPSVAAAPWARQIVESAGRQRRGRRRLAAGTCLTGLLLIAWLAVPVWQRGAAPLPGSMADVALKVPARFPATAAASEYDAAQVQQRLQWLRAENERLRQQVSRQQRQLLRQQLSAQGLDDDRLTLAFSF